VMKEVSFMAQRFLHPAPYLVKPLMVAYVSQEGKDPGGNRSRSRHITRYHD